MSIYLDLAFLINFLFDAQLICLSCLICSRKIHPFRVFLAAFTGGVQGMLVFFPYFGIFSLPSVNMAIMLLIAAIAICPCTSKEFFIFYITVISSSFFLAGLITFCGVRALWGILLTAPAYLAITKIRKEILSKRSRAVLYFKDKKIEKQALYDSGNSVFYFGKPVIFGSKELMHDFFGSDFSETDFENCEKLCVIPYKTLGKSGVVRGIRLDKAVVNGKSFEGAVLGFFDGDTADKIILNGIMV